MTITQIICLLNSWTFNGMLRSSWQIQAC